MLKSTHKAISLIVSLLTVKIRTQDFFLVLQRRTGTGITRLWLMQYCAYLFHYFYGVLNLSVTFFNWPSLAHTVIFNCYFSTVVYLCDILISVLRLC